MYEAIGFIASICTILSFIFGIIMSKQRSSEIKYYGPNYFIQQNTYISYPSADHSYQFEPGVAIFITFIIGLVAYMKFLHLAMAVCLIVLFSAFLITTCSFVKYVDKYSNQMQQIFSFAMLILSFGVSLLAVFKADTSITTSGLSVDGPEPYIRAVIVAISFALNFLLNGNILRHAYDSWRNHHTIKLDFRKYSFHLCCAIIIYICATNRFLDLLLYVSECMNELIG